MVQEVTGTQYMHYHWKDIIIGKGARAISQLMPILFVGHGSPTNEHYLPMLYILAIQEDDEDVSFFCNEVTLGSISMRSLRIG